MATGNATTPSDVIFCNKREAEFLAAFRKADPLNKRRVEKLLAAGAAGRLPPADVAKGMTREQVWAYADSLPEVP